MFALFNPFYGEISRKSWWTYQSVIWVIFALLAAAFYFLLAALRMGDGIADAFSTLFGVVAASVLAIVAIYMNFCSCVNRLRNTGRTGWWWLIFQVPVIGVPLMLYFCGIEEGDPVQRPMNIQRDLDALKARYEPQVEETSDPDSRFEKAIPSAPSPHDYGKRSLRQTGRRPVSIGGGQPRTSFGRRGAI
ncbi:DUF805 domain-containing protein [Cohaesibacter intestini]|uniref:DUF805 domain-containing protein n=1 Tax=Cohaesibacter intestini TaxID=2211145 RepID=UPI000DE8592F|nr:DUF805 domain-containing protein [Cohaesibacter intestini]